MSEKAKLLAQALGDLKLDLSKVALDDVRLPTRSNLVDWERGQFDDFPSEYDFLKDFVGSLKEILKNQDVSQVHYCHPKNPQGKCINSSAEETRKYAINLSNKIKKSGKNSVVSFITGKMGSGKSTFIRYLLNKFRSGFLDNKVALCLILHSDIAMPDNLAQNIVGVRDKDYEIFVKMRIRWAVLNSLSLEDGIKGALKHDYNKFLCILREKLEAHYDQNQRQQDLYYFNSLFEEGNISFEDFEKKVSIEAWNSLNKLLLDFEVKVLVVIDGLDVLNHSTIVDRGYDKLFVALSKCIAPDQSSAAALYSRISYVISLRNCTYDDFFPRFTDRTALQLKEFTNQDILEEVPFMDIMRDSIEILFRENDKKFWNYYKPKVIEMFEQIFLTFSDHFTERHGDNFSKYFEYNCRETADVTINIFCYISNYALKKINAGQKSDLQIDFKLIINEIVGVANSICKKKQYQILETILIGGNCGFHNRYSVTEGNFDRSTLHAHVRGGVIDNIFNYHLKISDTDTKSYFLVKIRLLQVLMAREDKQSLENLLMNLKCLGYELDEMQAKHLLYMMIDSNFIKTRYESAGQKLCYSITHLGRFVVNDLIYEMSYLENVVMTSFLPNEICTKNLVLGLVKYKSKRGFEKSSTPKFDWVKRCIINCIFLVAHIDYIESGWEKSFFENNKKLSDIKEFASIAIATNMRKKLSEQIANILASDSRSLSLFDSSREIRHIVDDLIEYFLEITKRESGLISVNLLHVLSYKGD